MKHISSMTIEEMEQEVKFLNGEIAKKAKVLVRGGRSHGAMAHIMAMSALLGVDILRPMPSGEIREIKVRPEPVSEHDRQFSLNQHRKQKAYKNRRRKKK